MRILHSLKHATLVVAAIASLSVAHADTPPPGAVNPAYAGHWAGVSGRDRADAVKVAREDVTRVLSERLHGLQIDSATTVYDYMLASDTIGAHCRALLRGATRIGEPQYTEDGIVMVVYGIKLSTLIDIMKADIAKAGNEDLLQKLDQIEVPKGAMLEAMGNGAVKGSPGMRMIRARRAAEADAYRKMAECIKGVRLSSESTVQNFCLKNQKIASSVAANLSGMLPTDIVYLDDGSCEVTMQLKVRQLVETLSVIVRRYEPGYDTNAKMLAELNLATIDEVFTVRGAGVGTEDMGPPRSWNTDPILERTSIWRDSHPSATAE